MGLAALAQRLTGKSGREGSGRTLERMNVQVAFRLEVELEGEADLRLQGALL